MLTLLVDIFWGVGGILGVWNGFQTVWVMCGVSAILYADVAQKK